MLKKSCILLLFCSLLPYMGHADIEVRNIKPPKLDVQHLGEKVLCHRPLRNGIPNMTVEKKESKIIAHNYGHGGSGWTLGPGAARYINDLLINSEYATNLDMDTPITVLGAGCIGLYTAYDLHQRGYKNITIVADKFERLTSHNAGGLLAPISMNNDPELQKSVNAIGVEAYRFYGSIANKQHKDFAEGAVIIPAYFQSREKSNLEPYVGLVMEPAKDVIVDFGNGTQRQMVVYDDGIFIDTARMMHALQTYLKNENVPFVAKKINAFKDIQDDFIINCTGMGASILNQDEQIVPIQGHLILLKDQSPEDLQYMITTFYDQGITSSGQKVIRAVYMFPKHTLGSEENDVGVIGGTFIVGASNATPNREEFDILVKNTKAFFGIE